MLRNVAEIVLEFSGKVRRILQNLGARSDKTERDRREVRRDMSEILARSDVSDRYSPLRNGFLQILIVSLTRKRHY